MKRRITSLITSIALIFIVPPMPFSCATTIDPLLWEQLVISCDFIGIVECHVAGGVVAKYKVIESWKGAPHKDDIISIRVAVNYWEPQFPIALCGERYLVTAYKAQPPSTMMSTSIGGRVPLWWREVSDDYRLPLFQGRINLDEHTKSFFDSPYTDLASFKKAAMELIQMSPENKEELLLRVLCDKYLFQSRKDYRGRNPNTPELDKKLSPFKVKIAEAETVEDIVSVLLAIHRQQELGVTNIDRILRQGGGRISLDVLEDLASEDITFDARRLRYILDNIRKRLNPPAKQETETPTKTKEPSKDKLRELRIALAQGPENRDFGQALDRLTVYSPEYVVDYLLSWVNPQEDWRDANQGYVLGSYFAWKCGRERKKHFKALTEAKDDYIRVAAAVYLTSEDAELGMRHLRKMLILEGDPGVWAALNLVRRGKKKAMPRALEVFLSRGEYGMAGVPHRNLQKRLLVLLSNSCKAAGIPMPNVKAGSKHDYVRWGMHEWWHDNKDEIIINDPWFHDLSKQKID